MKLPPLLALACLACSAAQSWALTDKATGLGVDLPENQFIVELSERENPQYQVVIGINTVSGQPGIVGTGGYLCEVAFQPAPQNEGLSQAEINASIEDPSWPEMARQTMSAILDFEASVPFDLAGIKGYEFIAVPKMGADAAEIRLVLSMLETPKGRTVVSCATDAVGLEDALGVFRTIRQSVTPPA